MNKPKLNTQSGLSGMLDEAVDCFQEKVEELSQSGKQIEIDYIIEDIQNEFNMNNQDAMEFYNFIYDNLEE
jgi:predicted solute-binding protein